MHAKRNVMVVGFAALLAVAATTSAFAQGTSCCAGSEGGRSEPGGGAGSRSNEGGRSEGGSRSGEGGRAGGGGSSSGGGRGEGPRGAERDVGEKRAGGGMSCCAGNRGGRSEPGTVGEKREASVSGNSGSGAADAASTRGSEATGPGDSGKGGGAQAQDTGDSLVLNSEFSAGETRMNAPAPSAPALPDTYAREIARNQQEAATHKAQAAQARTEAVEARRLGETDVARGLDASAARHERAAAVGEFAARSLSDRAEADASQSTATSVDWAAFKDASVDVVVGTILSEVLESAFEELTGMAVPSAVGVVMDVLSPTPIGLASELVRPGVTREDEVRENLERVMTEMRDRARKIANAQIAAQNAIRRERGETEEPLIPDQGSQHLK